MKQIRNAWWEGSEYHPMDDPMGRPRISLVCRGGLTQLCIPSLCKGKAETVHDERNSSSHSSHRKTPTSLMWEGRLTHLFTVFLWKSKRKAAHNEWNITSTEQSPNAFYWMWKVGLTQFCNQFLCKEIKTKFVIRRVGWSSHGWSHGKTVSSFCAGRETYSVFQHLNLQRKSRKSVWWEEHLIPQLIQEDPNVFNLGGRDSHIFWKCLSGIEREKQCMVRGDFSSHMQDFGKTPHSFSLVTTTYGTVNAVSLQKRQKKQGMMRWHSLSSHGKPVFLWLGKEDSPNSLICCPGKGREKQCMRGTSHPTAHTGRPHF